MSTPLPSVEERLDASSYVPLHVQLAELLRRQIEDGVYRPGDRLPSERELVERFGVSRITATAALQALVRSGLAYRWRGKGTFVARPKLREMSWSASFSEHMRSRGLTPSSRVLAFERIPASEEVAARLGLAPRTPVWHLGRVRLADGEPVAVEEAYLPADLFPGLEDEDLEKGSLYEVFRRRYALRPAWAEGIIEAAAADETQASLLGVRVDDPVLSVKRVTYNESYTALEWVHSVYRADRFSFATGRQPV
jgi:GntR family transcriptional regulator